MRALELKVPPGVVVVLAGAMMWGFARAAPRFDFQLPVCGFWAGTALVAGVVTVALGVGSFRRARTTFNPIKPESASTLVVAGIYRWTRNPMYLGLLLILTAWALVLENAMAFLVLPGFVTYLNRFQISPEEVALDRLFGSQYAAYRAKVRRWL